MGVRNWQIWYHNLITDASMITPDDENSNYPKENMLEMDYHSTFRSLTATDPYSIKIDFGVPKSFDSIILGNIGNLMLANLYYSDDDSSYNEVATYTILNITQNGINSELIKNISSGLHRYYQIDIQNSSLNIIEIGILMLCNEYVFPSQPNNPFSEDPQIKEDILRSITGYETRYKKYSKKKWSLNFNYIDTSFYDILKGLDEFFFCPDSDDYTDTYLCRRNGSPVKKEHNFDYCDTIFNIEELL